MDNTEEILSKFGGVITNDLNNVLQIDEENDERLSTFSRSLYIDINQNGPFDLPKRKTFNMLSINIQSINAKFNNLLLYLSILDEKKLSFDVINIQETWLSAKDDAEKLMIKQLYNIPGYNLIIRGKTISEHGGLFTYIKDSYNFTERPLCNSLIYEGLFIDIFSENFIKKITLANIYRPPRHNNRNSEIKCFMDEIKPIVDSLSKEKSSLTISGDFNINLLEINNRERYQEFLDIFLTRGLFPQITLPTRFSSRRATLIDHIYCNTKDENRAGKSAIIIGKLSDHFAVCCCMDVFTQRDPLSRYVCVQENSARAIENFVLAVESSIQNTHFKADLLTNPNGKIMIYFMK